MKMILYVIINKKKNQKFHNFFHQLKKNQKNLKIKFFSRNNKMKTMKMKKKTTPAIQIFKIIILNKEQQNLLPFLLHPFQKNQTIMCLKINLKKRRK